MQTVKIGMKINVMTMKQGPLGHRGQSSRSMKQATDTKNVPRVTFIVPLSTHMILQTQFSCLVQYNPSLYHTTHAFTCVSQM
jgi:hypothetical protein